MTFNQELQTKVVSQLAWDPGVVATDIDVVANDGVVTLSGHVSSYAQKHAAELTVSNVKGVAAVVQHLIVQLPVDIAHTDELVAAAAVSALAWDVTVPKNIIRVMVENGWVTLSGEVAGFFQKDAAENALRRLVGVTGLTNDVKIRPAIDAGRISDEIRHAQRRSWFFDPATVDVNVAGGKVRLTGTVGSAQDRRVAAATAWASPGVTDVENEITIA